MLATVDAVNSCHHSELQVALAKAGDRHYLRCNTGIGEEQPALVCDLLNFLKKLSDHDLKHPFGLPACARLSAQQGEHEEAMGKRDEALTLTDTVDASNPVQISKQ